MVSHQEEERGGERVLRTVRTRPRKRKPTGTIDPQGTIISFDKYIYAFFCIVMDGSVYVRNPVESGHAHLFVSWV